MTTTHAYINELVVGQNICDNYILKSFLVKLTRAGKQYLDLTLTDSTGSINGKMWDVDEDTIAGLSNGCFVSTVFTVSSYNDVLQADIKGIQKIEATELTTEEKSFLVPCIDDDPYDVFDELMIKIGRLSNPKYRELGTDILTSVKDKLVSCPGAKSVHHAEIGGLVLHSLEVVQFVEAIYSVTPWFDKELCVLAGALHDIGKITEFALGETGLVSDYSTAGQLLGHIYMGTEYIGEEAKKHGFTDEETMLLQHVILSHHGEPDFGSPVTPHTMEAEVVHMADDLSAKLHVFKDAVKDVEPGAFSDKIFALDGIKVYRPTNS